MAVVKAAQVL